MTCWTPPPVCPHCLKRLVTSYDPPPVRRPERGAMLRYECPGCEGMWLMPVGVGSWNDPLMVVMSDE